MPILQLVDPIKRLPGASDVTIFGEKRYSMRIWLDPDRLAQLGVTAGDVQQAILEQNLQVASGKLGQAPVAGKSQAFELQINTLGRLSDVKQFEEHRHPRRGRQHRRHSPARPGPG